jgi:hypothetical protein
MKGDFSIKIIFDIIVLIVLVILIYYIITALIGLAMGKDFEYIGYLNSIADAINSNNANGQIFIDNYDYNYVFALTYNNGWYLQLYHCFPPNVVEGLLSVKLAYWNVSTTNNGDIVFAPALAFCKLIKQRSLNNNIDQINITIQGLNDNAGLLALDANDNNLHNLIINMPLTDNFFLYNSLAILNDTNITCNNSECTYTSSIGESGNMSCSPYPNMNSNNNNLPYNPSVCVELSGFPQNPQISYSNLEGEIIDASTLGSLFQEEDFPLLYFAGSLPPTVMYIDVNSNGGTADINIYIGETVS